MRDGRVGRRDTNNVSLSRLDTFANSFRHFAGLAHAHTDMALAIAHNYHCAETKASATLDHLGDAVDLNDALFQLKIVRVNAFLCHNSSEIGVMSYELRSRHS